MRQLVLSEYGMFASERECFPVGGKKDAKTAWLARWPLYLDANKRVFAQVVQKENTYFMDAVTGSLYLDGKCLSSDNLTVSGLVPSTKEARARLMAVKAEV